MSSAVIRKYFAIHIWRRRRRRGRHSGHQRWWWQRRSWLKITTTMDLCPTIHIFGRVMLFPHDFAYSRRRIFRKLFVVPRRWLCDLDVAVARAHNCIVNIHICAKFYMLHFRYPRVNPWLVYPVGSLGTAHLLCALQLEMSQESGKIFADSTPFKVYVYVGFELELVWCGVSVCPAYVKSLSERVCHVKRTTRNV